MDIKNNDEFLPFSGNYRFERLNLTIRWDNSDEWHYLDGLSRDDLLIHVERLDPEALGSKKIDWAPFSCFIVTCFGETTMNILLNSAPATDEYNNTLYKIAGFAFEKEHGIRYVSLQDTPFEGYLSQQAVINEWGSK